MVPLLAGVVVSGMVGAGGFGTGASDAPFEPQPETVDALLSATVRVIEDERARGET